MEYQKTEWTAPQGNNFCKYKKIDETADSVTLISDSNITKPGTPFSVGNMNKIEEGIYKSHEIHEKKQDKLVTLNESPESSILPETSASLVNNHLQMIRNNLKYLFNHKVNHIVGEAKLYFCELSNTELAANRLLKPAYQLLKITDYQELFNRMFCGNSKNDTALWWYRCTSTGVRTTDTITGTHFRMISPEGLFPRFAGQNKVCTAANDTPYDGKSVGEFQKDQFQYFIPYMSRSSSISSSGSSAVMGTNSYGDNRYGLDGFEFRAPGSGMARTGNETRPASLSFAAYITY